MQKIHTDQMFFLLPQPYGVGGVVLYPTDTIWGVGCDAEDDDAVKRIYKIKQRPDSKAC